MEWECFSTEGLPPRYEHASFISRLSSDNSSHTLCVFAGAKPEGAVSDVWKLDLGNVAVYMTTHPPHPFLNVPSSFHACVYTDMCACTCVGPGVCDQVRMGGGACPEALSGSNSTVCQMSFSNHF